MKVLTALGLCVTMTALLAGCSSPQNAIVGKWKSTGRYPATLEFFKDGTVSFNGGYGGGTGGKYSFPDDKHIQVVNGPDSIVNALQIKGDTLTLTNETNSSITRGYHRVTK